MFLTESVPLTESNIGEIEHLLIQEGINIDDIPFVQDLKKFVGKSRSEIKKYAQKSHQKREKAFTQTSKDLGVDEGKFRAEISKAAQSFSSRHKALTESFLLEADKNKQTDNFFKAYYKAWKKSITDIKSENLDSALLFFLLVLGFQMFIAHVLATVVTGMAHFLIVAVIVAPLTEEYGRKLATENGAGNEYTAVLNAYEFFNYVKNGTIHLLFAGYSLLRSVIYMVIVRLLAAFGLHQLNQTIMNVDVDKKKNEGKNRQVSDAAYWTAVGIHSLWNAGGGRIVLAPAQLVLKK